MHHGRLIHRNVLDGLSVAVEPGDLEIDRISPEPESEVQDQVIAAVFPGATFHLAGQRGGPSGRVALDRLR